MDRVSFLLHEHSEDCADYAFEPPMYDMCIATYSAMLL